MISVYHIGLNQFNNTLIKVIQEIIENIVYSPIVFIFYMAVGFLLMKISISKIELSINFSEYITRKKSIQLKFLREFLYHIFNIFSNEEVLVEKFFNKMYSHENKNIPSFVDIDIKSFTNVFNYTTTTIKTSSIGGEFKKELTFRCSVSKYSITIYPIKSGGRPFNAEHYDIYPKRFEMDRYVKFNNDNQYVNGNRVIDILHNFYINGDKSILIRLIENLIGDTYSWNKCEKNGLKRIYEDQNNNII